MKQKSSNSYRIIDLVEHVSEEINGILRSNLYETSLDKEDITTLRRRKSELRLALRNCGIGDAYAKKYVKQVIRKILLSRFVKDVSDYEKYIPFSSPDSLSARDKFDIVLYYLELEHGEQALSYMLEEYVLNERTDAHMGIAVTEQCMEEIYYNLNIYLSSVDKLNILVQRVYSQYKGLGVVDEIRDMKLEGVSGGVSGGEGQYDNVWILYNGLNIHMQCLSFEDETELERICMNIYRYGSPGQLSKSKGYIVNEMKDHSRIVVVRPPFAESFAFFVRKFDTIESKKVTELITDDGKELVEDVLRFIVRGCQVAAITGAQGSDKTTLLMSLIEYIPPAYTMRIQETAFELHLRDIYPQRNILTFQETEYVSGQEGLDIQKKTDGVVNILGEISTNDVAAWMIQMSQVASLFTLFTHHAKTTEHLIKYMRNALIVTGRFNSETIALEQVVDAIRFDIHTEKDIYGHRYIERVSEIVRVDSKGGYMIRDILRYTKEGYKLVGAFSDDTASDMLKHMGKEDVERFYETFGVQDKQGFSSN